MDLYVTEIKAICPHTGEMKTYGGPDVPGISFEDAQFFCDTKGLGYCKVVGKLVAEVPCKEGKFGLYEPDFNNMQDYEKKSLN